MELSQEILDILGYVGLGLGVFYFLLILFSVFKGWRRGVIRQSIRTGTIILSVIASIVAIKVFVGNFADACDGVTFGALLENYGLAETIGDLGLLGDVNATVVKDVALTVIAPTLFPIVFTVLFMVISFVLYIIYAIVMIFVKRLRKRNNTKKTRLFGALVGLVQGIFVAAIFFLPFTNIFDIADNAVDNLREIDDDATTEIVEIYDEVVDPVYSFPLKVSNALGGKMFANIVATVDIDGESYNTRKPIVLLAEVYGDVMKLGDVDIENLTDDDQEAIRNLEEKIMGDRFFATLISNLFRQVGELVENGTIDLEVDEQLTEVFDAFLVMFTDSTPESIKRDMETLLDVLFLMTDEGVISAISNQDDDKLFDALTKFNVVNGEEITVFRQILKILEANPHTQPIVTVLMKLSLTIMADHLEFGEELDAIYEEIQRDIVEINDVDKSDSEAVHGKLDEILGRHEINLDDETVDDMSDYIVDNYADKEITEADINDIIASYYEAGLAASVQ